MGTRLTMDGNVVDGITPDSVVGSPASSAGGPSRQRQKQVPISRNTGSGYERPERARTSHACEPCRERKTKCDGERPSCRRCLHTGTPCHYGYGKGWKKRKTAEDLTVTSSKLARYERLLNEIFPLVSTDVRNMIDDARQQEFTPMTASEHADLQTMAANTFDPDARRSSPSLHRLPQPGPLPMTQSAPAFISTPRALPHPLPSDSSQSPLPSASNVPRSSKSPPDDLSINSAIRLPSITRHGFLVEESSRSSLGPGSATPMSDAQPSAGLTDGDSGVPGHALPG